LAGSAVSAVSGADYVGRFAPSPTGPLHLGSLVAALASFLDARAHGGRWLMRMEDIDPPREVPGAAARILRQLKGHGLVWDGPVLYQSQRLQAYEDVLAALYRHGLIYPCDCSRARIRELGGSYDGHCRLRTGLAWRGAAVRMRLPQPATVEFDDLFQGRQVWQLHRDPGDFVLRRRDGLIAYQLAVVVDDLYQGITHVIRGSDLLDSTPRQVFLMTQLGAQSPAYGHIPLVVNSVGQKLSKQNLAPAIDVDAAPENLWWAMAWLGLTPPAVLRGARPKQLLDWAVGAWQRPKPRAGAAQPAPPAG